MFVCFITIPFFFESQVIKNQILHLVLILWLFDSLLAKSESITGKYRSSIACYICILFMSQLSSFYVTVGFLLFHGCNMNNG